MPDNIGNASLKLSTDGTALQSGLQAAQQQIGAWAGRVGGVLKTALGPVGMVATTIVTAIMHPFEKLKELGGIAKQADVLGMLPSELAGMQKLLEKAGVSGDQVGSVFAIMGRNVQAALNGATDAVEGLDGELEVINGKGKAKVFQQLGIDLEQLRGKNDAEIFRTISDAIAKLPKGAEQAAAAMAVAGKSGHKLLEVMQMGAEGQQAYIDKLKASGVILSDEQYKAAANAQKAWKSAKKEISSAWEGLSNQATLVAAPVVEFIATNMKKAFEYITPVFAAMREGLEMASIILEKVGQEIQAFIDEIVTGIKQLIKESGNFSGSWVSAGDVVKDVFMGVGIAVAALKDLIVGVTAQVKILVRNFEELYLQAVAIKALVTPGADWGAAKKKVDDFRAETERIRQQRNDAFDFKTVEQFKAWFGKQNFERKPFKPGGNDPAVPKPPKEIDFSKVKQVAAMIDGSKDAYDMEAKFATNKLLGGDAQQKKIEEQQLDQLKRINIILDKVERKFGDPVVLQAA